MNRLYLSPPHLSGMELELVKEAFASNWVAPLGPMVDAFETEICAFTGAKHAVAVSSGTAALHLSLMLLGVSRGDTVICPSFTFAGSAFPIRYLDAVPVFVDSESASWNMDPALLDEAIRDRSARGAVPKAIIAVHLYGQCANLDAIMAIGARYGIPIVEDAAESLGAEHRGRQSGSLAPLGVLSFNGNKIITTSGGGMLLCHTGEAAARGKFLATQAREPTKPSYTTTISRRQMLIAVAGAAGCALAPRGIAFASEAWRPSKEDEAFLDDLERQGCLYFWEQASPKTGQVLDRSRNDLGGARDPRRMASIASTGFGLTALCIADRRGYLPHAQVVERVKTTLEWHLNSLPEVHGFFYHFADIETGERFHDVELSSIDTSLLLCGVLTARAYFDDPHIQSLAQQIYERVDWPWMLNGGEAFSMGWKPDTGFLTRAGRAISGRLDGRLNRCAQVVGMHAQHRSGASIMTARSMTFCSSRIFPGQG